MTPYITIPLGIILSLVGIIGSLLPALPGPPLNYLALLLIYFTQSPAPFGKLMLIIFGLLTALASVIDYIFPLIGAKLYGVSRYGLWGACIGMVAGMLFFPVAGMILGIIIGAVAGELLSGKKKSQAIKAGAVSFLCTLLSTVFKLSLSAVMTFYFIIALWH